MTASHRRTPPTSLDDGRWDGLVVVVAGTSWDGIWFPEKHVALRLPAYAPVLYVDPPRPIGQRGAGELQLVRPGLARLTPAGPPAAHRPGIRAVTDAFVRAAVRRAVDRLGARPRAIVVATHQPLLDACDADLRVLYATDDFAAGGELMGVPERRLLAAQDRQAASADLVVAASPVLRDKWAELGVRTVLVPNGVDVDLFADTDYAEPADDVTLRPPIAGYVGHLSERIDVALLDAVAASGVSVLLVGPRQPTYDLERLEHVLARSNVQWVGARPFGALPSYLRHMTAGLTPYRDDEFNRASWPLKTLEYLAAGRRAVATDLPSVRWLRTELVSIASTPAAFADAVSQALATTLAPAERATRRAFAGPHSWAARTAWFASALGLTGAAVPPGRPR